ncbi:MAG: Tad domain-containing protein [Rhodobacteraceae bacterium]|nr:Tad domain-containing protein [Paracoccaceae bacterium]
MLSYSKNVLNFAEDESGAGTVFALGWAVICIAIGGFAIDVTNAWSVEQRLQSSTDIAAHAAAAQLIRGGNNATPASEAIATVAMNLPESRFGNPLIESDVTVGYWDFSSHTLVEGGSQTAVRVVTRLDGVNGKVVPTFLLKIIGINFWEMNAQSVFIVDTPACANDGFIAGGIVDISSNNTFVNGFCIHGNQGVDINSSILFGEGVRITMPNSALMEDGGMFAEKGSDHNYVDGRENQVGDQYLEPSLATMSNIEQMLDNLADPTHPDQPDYITNMTVNRIPLRRANAFDITDLVPNAVNIIECRNAVVIPDTGVIRDVVIIAECAINFAGGAVVENAIIANTDTGNHSMDAPSGLQLGRDDHCAPGGGVTIISPGEVHFAAQMEWYGTQLIANGDVHISANVDGIEGLSVQTEGDIKATSNMDMGQCGGGVDHYVEQKIVRMVY